MFVGNIEPKVQCCMPCKGSLVRNRSFKRTWIRPSVSVSVNKKLEIYRMAYAPASFNHFGTISRVVKRDPKRLRFKARMEPFSGTPPKSCSFFKNLQKFHAGPGGDFDENFAKTVHIPFATIANVEINKVRVLSSLNIEPFVLNIEPEVECQKCFLLMGGLPIQICGVGCMRPKYVDNSSNNLFVD